MSRFRRVRASGDEGAALVMALVFLVVVGLFASAALDKSASTTLSGSALRERAMLQYALDGGIERAISVLQDDLAAATDPTLCTQASTSTTDLTSVRDGAALTLNGHSVKYSCQGLAGKAGKDSDNSWTNYALVLTDENDDALTTQSGSSQDLVIGGSLYLAGSLTDGALKKPVHVQGGSVVQLRKTCDRAQLHGLAQLKVDQDQLRECTDQTVAQATPDVTLPVAPDSPTAYVDYPKGKAAKCRVFVPSLFNEPPGLLAGSNSVNWFIGGTYHLDFTGSGKTWTIQNNASVIVGSASGDGITIPSGCPSISKVTGGSATAGGGTFVFGGTSKLVVAGSLVMGMPKALVGEQPVSIMTARTQDAARGYEPWTADGELLLETGNANSELVLKGKLLAPDARASLFASLPTTAMLQRGAVLHRLSLGASVAADAIAVTSDGTQANPPATFRTLRLVASDVGGSTAQQTAIVSISNSSPYTATVHSWRSE